MNNVKKVTVLKSNAIEILKSTPHQELSNRQQPGPLKILKILLADESILSTRLRNYQWNLSEANSYSLHMAFKGQIHQIATIEDIAAQHIHQYGANVPGTMGEFLRMTHLFEEPGVYPAASLMVANLVDDHETIMRFLRKDIESMSKESGDAGMIDFMTSLLHQHKKMVWTLRMWREEQAAATNP